MIHAQRARLPVLLVLLVTTSLAGASISAWATPMTVRASVDTAGGDPDDVSFNASISSSGRYVAFESDASDLVPDDGNGATDVFVRDLVEGVTARASVDTAGGDSDSFSFSPSISSSGRYVAFHSFASDLVPDDGNGIFDVFVRKMT